MERDAKAANGSAAAGCAGAACDDNPNRSVDAAGAGAAVGAGPWKW